MSYFLLFLRILNKYILNKIFVKGNLGVRLLKKTLQVRMIRWNEEVKDF
jgi:hypothetical protein